MKTKLAAILTFVAVTSCGGNKSSDNNTTAKKDLTSEELSASIQESNAPEFIDVRLKDDKINGMRPATQEESQEELAQKFEDKDGVVTPLNGDEDKAASSTESHYYWGHGYRAGYRYGCVWSCYRPYYTYGRYGYNYSYVNRYSYRGYSYARYRRAGGYYRW